MLDNVMPSRYRTTYRQNEVDHTCRLALQGESLCFLGLAGVGKSNLVNYLHLAGPARVQALSGRPLSACFPIVDARGWQCTPSSMWGLMLGALADVSRDVIPSIDGNLSLLSEEDQAFRRLQLLLGRVCQDLRRPVMFVLDDFDRVLETGPLAMLERLNTLRNEGNRGLLSYLVFVKRLPHVLGRQFNLEHDSKFYELWRNNVYPLGLYNSADALQMAEYLNTLDGRPLLRRELGQLCALAGGHARLLKNIFRIRVRTGPLSPDPAAGLAADPAIRRECQRILENLHEQERAVAVRTAYDRLSIGDLDTLNHLLRRGLLISVRPLVWFSPVMGAFLRSYTL